MYINTIFFILSLTPLRLTSSITTDIAAGFIFYPVLKAVRGQWREVHPLVYVFGLLSLIQFIFFQ